MDSDAVERMDEPPACNMLRLMSAGDAGGRARLERNSCAGGDDVSSDTNLGTVASVRMRFLRFGRV